MMLGLTQGNGRPIQLYSLTQGNGRPIQLYWLTQGNGRPIQLYSLTEAKYTTLYLTYMTFMATFKVAGHEYLSVNTCTTSAQ